MFRQLFTGPRVPYAPETDDGADFEDEFDDTADDFEDQADEEDEDEEEPDDLAAEEDDEEEQRPAARQPSRASRRVESATRAAKEARERAERAEAELQMLRNQRAMPQGESPQQREERLSQMEPWDRRAYETNERLARMEWDNTERMDQMAFNAVCRDDPVAAGMKADVERELQALRARGQNVDRETLYTFLLGQRARSNAGRSTGRAKKTAAASRERQQARPANGRGDTAPENRRSNSTQARDRRVENYEL